MKNRPKIVIVEDESIAAEDLKYNLEKLGYTVPAAISSGQIALKCIEEIRPDLVLMDIGLRGEIDGIEIADQLRSDFNIPVVYITSYTDEKTLERAKKTKPRGYIIKPYDIEELHSTIKMALCTTKSE